MNYKIIFFLLFAFITSNRILEDSASACKTASSKDQCQTIENPLTDSQCCYYTLIEGSESSGGCIDYYENIDGIYNFYSSEKFYAYNKEISGYVKYVFQMQLKRQDISYDCKNGQIAYTIGDYEYTEAEQKIIKDEKFCYNKYVAKSSDPEFDIGNCEDSLMLDSSKKSGFECGNVLYIIQASGKTISYKLCEYFNINYYDEMVKLSIKSEFKDTLKKKAQSITSQNGYRNYTSFVVEYYNQKGEKMKYDSKEDQFTIIIPTTIENEVPMKRKGKKFRDWKTVTMMKKFKGLKRYRIIKRLEELKGLKN